MNACPGVNAGHVLAEIRISLPLAGGALIGLAAAALLALTGKTAGVSGILDGLLRGEKGEFSWKLAFVITKQLSAVCRLIVCVPAGAAFVRVITPVILLTLMPPV